MGSQNTPPAGSQNTPPAGSQNTPPAGKPVKMHRCRCTENCTFQGRYRRQGEIIELPEKDVPHFEFAGE